MKIDKFVKIQDVGVGKITGKWENDIEVTICDKKYYRNISEDREDIGNVIPSTEKEYIEFLKFMVKELIAKSKNKRSEAAEYNREVEGVATKRKGKVVVINGTYAFGLCENSISRHHSSLLSDAKKAKELKDKLKKELDWYKHVEKVIKEAEKERKNKEKNAG